MHTRIKWSFPWKAIDLNMWPQCLQELCWEQIKIENEMNLKFECVREEISIRVKSLKANLDELAKKLINESIIIENCLRK